MAPPHQQDGNSNMSGQAREHLQVPSRVSTISSAQARYIRPRLEAPSDAPGAETKSTLANWKVMLDHFDKKHSRSALGMGRGDRGEGESSAPDIESVMSGRRLFDSILDDDGLSRVDLDTANSQVRQRIRQAIERNHDYFRAQLDSNRRPSRQKAAGGKNTEPVAGVGTKNVGSIAGSGFESVQELSKGMDELLRVQGEALQCAVQCEVEIKRLHWLKQHAMRLGEQEAREERRG